MEESEKYCRSLHAGISLGSTSDDRFMPSGYLKAFANMGQLILSEKIDGQNNAFTRYGVFARSHAAVSMHPWDKPLKERWNLIKNDLKDIELFGENMYGIHSIGYKKLESFYYLFAVRVKDTWLSWEEVKFYAEMYDFPTVPELPIKVPLNDLYTDDVDESKILEDWLLKNLGMKWTEYVETSGQLGGYSPKTGKDCSEGFVIRNANSYKTNDGVIPVAKNEFNNLFKIVRKKHVETDVHWTKTWKPTTLIDYTKYKWFGYKYLSKI